MMKQLFKYSRWIMILFTGIIILSAIASSSTPATNNTFIRSSHHIVSNKAFSDIHKFCNHAICLIHSTKTTSFSGNTLRRASQRQNSSRNTSKYISSRQKDMLKYYVSAVGINPKYPNKTKSDCYFNQLCKLSI